MSTADQKILTLGGTGQIGSELRRQLADLGRLLVPSRGDLDLAEPTSIREFMRHARPALVINAAAYTAVDRAESEADLCARINAEAPGALAEECRRIGAALIHFSTDYVFDGSSRVPYVETDATAPLNVYGRTKLDGERAIAAANPAHLIVRTSWVYAARGHNFPLTMLRLAHQQGELRIVNDQIGAPTSARAIARGVMEMLQSLGDGAAWAERVAPLSGIYHMTAAGSTTWFEFAQRILADDPRRADQQCRAIRPITTDEYPTPAKRPLVSLLDNTKLNERFGIQLPSWTDQWADVANELRLTRS